ncbi:hypothetical protein Vretimale_12826, partial [Volvox reticuliferus]
PPTSQPRLLDSSAAVAAYDAAVGCMDDDAEESRAAAAALVSTLAVLVPELPYGTHFGVAARLVDDAFMRLCALVADPQRGLKLQALRALGGLHAASLRVKLQALSKKTTLRVAAPPPVAPPAAAAAGTAAIGAVSGGAPAASGGVKAGGKRPAADMSSAAAAAAAGASVGAKQAGGGGSTSKRLTAAAWEMQSWLTASTARSGSRSGFGPVPGSGSGSTSGPPGGAGSPDAAAAVASDDLTLLENAVGAFVLGSEDEHWEVRVATLDAMSRLAEYEYRTAAAAAAAAAATADPATNAAAAAVTAGRDVRGAATAGTAGVPPTAAAGSAVAAAARVAAPTAGNGGRGASGGTAVGLSVRIGGIGGTAGSRIAAGSGNAEAAAAICEALIDALLDELPEVRQAAARGVGRLLQLEAQARRKIESAALSSRDTVQAATATTATATVAATATATATAAPMMAELATAAVPRRSLSPLLTEELVRALASAVRDKDGETRRAVVGALGRLRLSRPGLLREVVQVRGLTCWAC